jgi:hypothetical protein
VVSFPTHAFVTEKRPIDDIVKQAPFGMVPMFFISSSPEDQLLGLEVVMKNGKLYTCVSDQAVDKSLVSGLRFHRYIKE